MSKAKGFTLIELMIVVAVIAILASIAYPSYQDSVRKTRRADAKEVLLEGAQWMERFFTENYRYDKNKAGTAIGSLFPTNLTASPKEGTTKYYDITSILLRLRAPLPCEPPRKAPAARIKTLVAH